MAACRNRFYSGFKASTVDRYLEKIRLHFPDYRSVSNYSLIEIEEIKNDPNMKRNKSQIDACIKNAKKVSEIVGKYSSIKNYIDFFDPNSSDNALYMLKKVWKIILVILEIIPHITL